MACSTEWPSAVEDAKEDAPDGMAHEAADGGSSTRKLVAAGPGSLGCGWGWHGVPARSPIWTWPSATARRATCRPRPQIRASDLVGVSITDEDSDNEHGEAREQGVGALLGYVTGFRLRRGIRRAAPTCPVGRASIGHRRGARRRSDDRDRTAPWVCPTTVMASEELGCRRHPAPLLWLGDRTSPRCAGRTSPLTPRASRQKPTLTAPIDLWIESEKGPHP